jgi:peptidoglycan/xylan/chitin deacetylase (PgdA/CDA1 family)
MGAFPEMKFLIIRKRALAAVAVVVVILLILALFIMPATALAQAKTRKTPVYRVKTDEKKIAISFDACWGADKTDSILACLNELDVKANYFCVSSWVDKYPDTARKLASSGKVEIGTHSATHPKMSKLSASAQRSELVSSCEVIEKIVGVKPTLFRPPYGDYDDKLIDNCAALGLTAIQWDVDTLDWKDLSAQAIAKRVMERAKEGSIVLMHNDGKHTLEALPLIIIGLRQKGYEFVWISELLHPDGVTDGSGTQLPTS